MLRRTARREYTRLAEAHEWEKAQLRKAIATAEETETLLVNSIVRRVNGDRSFDDTVTIMIRLDPVFTRKPSELPRLIAERAVVELYRLHDDWRGDLRQTDMQRALGRRVP